MKELKEFKRYLKSLDEEQLINLFKVAELSDSDFPYFPASQRAYCWLKKHIEQSE